jgi:hypothetical protein
MRSLPSVTSEFFFAGSRHKFAPGETRAKVDYSRFFTFYDPAFSSLVRVRRSQTVDQYRAGNASAADVKDAQARIANMFIRQGKGSGIDWGSISQVVVDRYGDRLSLMKHLLENPGSRNVTEQVSQIRSQVLIMLTPYMLVDVIPSSESGSRSWIAPIAKQCASSLTAWTPIGLLTREEEVIKHAVEEVLHEICDVFTDIWVDAFDVEGMTAAQARGYLQKWEQDIGDLMTWLDWSVWATCSPACGPEVLVPLLYSIRRYSPFS